MTKFPVSVLAVCLLVLPLIAQEPQPEAPPPPAENERSVNVRPAAGRSIATEADLAGANGALIWELPVTDTILRSNSSLRFQTGGGNDRVWFFSNGHAAFGALGDQGRLSIFEYGDTVKALAVHHRSNIETSVTQNDFASYVQAYTDIAPGVTNSGTLYGSHIDTRNYGPGSLLHLNGLSVYAGNRPSGGTVTTTNATGVFIHVQHGSGTIDTGYGMRIADTLATNGWGVYQMGTNDLNYFGGTVGIGTTTPQQKLHVFGSDNAGTLIQAENTSTGTAAHAAFRTTSALSSTSYVAHGNRDASVARFGMTLAGWSEIVNFTGNGLVMGTTLNTPLVFGTNGAEQVRIHGSGRISIGTTAATEAKLGLQHIVPIASTGYNSDVGFLAAGANSVPAGVTNTGGVIGGRLDGWNYGPGSVAFVTGGYFRAGNYPGTTGTVTTALGLQAEVRAESGTITNGYGIFIQNTQALNDFGIYQSSTDDTNYFAGNVVIGSLPGQELEMLTVKGNAKFLGTVTGTNIQAHYQDVAEWVPATTDLTPGTVVILNRERNNEVMASATAYDTTVAGVVSAQPGISLGVEGDNKEQIATTGRVRVRVDARTTPVRVGDLLVTSDIAGTAMRSEPMEINGRQFHQPGTIIGKALEPLAGGIGEILVLLSMQ